jgi:dienelactone hydrolase
MPSSVTWPGFSWEDPDEEIPVSWSEGGKPIPTLPGAPAGDRFSFFSAGLKTVGAHPDAVIPVERIAGEVLLICGEDDQLWPSCPMARQVESRARERKRPQVSVLAYPNAGHSGFGQPLPDGDPRMASLARMGGGTPEGNNKARADSWEKILLFLKRTLQPDK